MLKREEEDVSSGGDFDSDEDFALEKTPAEKDAEELKQTLLRIKELKQHKAKEARLQAKKDKVPSPLQAAKLELEKLLNGGSKGSSARKKTAAEKKRSAREKLIHDAIGSLDQDDLPSCN